MIYGAIIGLALVVVLESHPPAPGVVVGSLLASGLAVALAELYSEVVCHRDRAAPPRRARAGRRGIVDDVVAVFFGVTFPAVFFVLAAAGAMEVDTAFDVAKWSGVGLIGFYGYSASAPGGRRSG